MELRPEEITKIIRSQIKNYENKLEVSETGIVILVGDGIAKASGLEKCMAGELVEFPNGAYGMAQNLEEETVSIVILGDDNGILVVKAVSAIALSQAQMQKLTAKLEAITGKTIDLQCSVDAAQLGGLRLSYSGVQVDGTVKTKLDSIGKLLKNTVL